MRALNLYAGVGGNRALWPADAQVTSVELDPQIAEAYAELWPDDELIVGDAHQFLLDHFTEGWDVIWSSPPCQSHTKLRRFAAGKGDYRYADLDHLYGEILLLSEFSPPETAWMVENVIPYYEPLIPPTSMLGRHYGWSNKWIPYIASGFGPRIASERKSSYKLKKKWLSQMEVAEAGDFERSFGITLPACADSWGRQKRRQVMRNCVDPTIGLAVWNALLQRDSALQETLLEVGQ